MKKIIALNSLLAVSIYPVIFAYTHNIHEVKFSETIIPAIIAFAVAAFVFEICFVIVKDFYKASLSGIIFMLLYWNYSLIEEGINIVIKSARYWHILPVILVIYVHIVVYIKRKKVQQMSMYKIVAFLGAIFIALSIFNVTSVMANQVLTDSKTRQQAESQDTGAVASLRGKPNVYYIILDEYGAFEVMKKYYQYGNSDFKEFLMDKGFTVSESSKNIAPNTVIMIPNLLNYDYIVNESIMGNYKYKESSALFNLFRNSGYKTYAIDTLVALSPTLPKISADVQVKLSNTESSSNEFEKMVLSGTILKIADVVMNPDKRYFSYVRGILNNSFNNIENLSKEKTEGRFVFAHIMCPHEPFVFDKNGDYIDDELNANNWEDKKYYLGQYIYITNKVRQSIATIIENDPDCIIILQSDHSMRSLKNMQEEDKVKILNAVYYRREKFDNINKISGLNTLRMVLSKLFSIDLPLLED